MEEHKIEGNYHNNVPDPKDFAGVRLRGCSKRRSRWQVCKASFEHIDNDNFHFFYREELGNLGRIKGFVFL